MNVISGINTIMWGGPLLILLLGIHIYFTIRTKFVQRKLRKALKYSLEGDSAGSPPQAATARVRATASTRQTRVRREE